MLVDDPQVDGPRLAAISRLGTRRTGVGSKATRSMRALTDQIFHLTLVALMAALTGLGAALTRLGQTL